MFHQNYFSRHSLYFYLLMMLAGSLPLSKFMLTVSMMLLFIFWIVDPQLPLKVKSIFKKPAVWILCSVYLVHLLGMLYTTDINYGLKDLRIKLPLLLFPLVLGTTPSLNFKELKVVLYVFIAALLINTFYCTAILFGIIQYEYTDIRHISVLMSHIRLSLLIVIAFYIGIYYLFFQKQMLKNSEQIALWVISAWFIAFLVLLKAMTGIIIWMIFGYGLLFILSGKLKSRACKFSFRTILILIPIAVVFYISLLVKWFYRLDEIDPNKLDTYTVKGEKYAHNPEIKTFENGHFIWIYIAEEELKTEWQKRSNFDYYGLDKRNQPIRETIIRYMTSKGLRKDAEGVSKLTDADIRYIENGNTNYIFTKKFSIYPRIYEIIWEIDHYLKGGNPGGHSVIQRIEYVRTALLIISDHFFFGTGTGDVAQAFQKKYDEINSPLPPRWQMRAHNQYVTFFLTFGLIGFLWIMFSFVAPVFYENKQRDYLFILVFIVSALSMLNEDTLETHHGISMVTFFYSLFIFRREGRS